MDRPGIDPQSISPARPRGLGRDHGRRVAGLDVPVVLETFTFLERNVHRDVALAWQASLADLARFEILPCSPDDLARAWAYFRRRDLHKLSAVDATSFVIMKRERIRFALSFDHHFAAVGFHLVG